MRGNGAAIAGIRTTGREEAAARDAGAIGTGAAVLSRGDPDTLGHPSQRDRVPR